MEKVKLGVLDSMQGVTKGSDTNNIADKGGYKAVYVTSGSTDEAAKELKYRNRGKFSGLVPIQPPSVSWRVPRKNHDNKDHDKHPGFYSDYSRPRTRPPSHN